MKKKRTINTLDKVIMKKKNSTTASGEGSAKSAILCHVSKRSIVAGT